MSIMPKPNEVASKINTLPERFVPIVTLLVKGEAAAQNVSSTCNVSESSAHVYVSQVKKHLGLTRVPLSECREILAQAMKMKQTSSRDDTAHGSNANASTGIACLSKEAIDKLAAHAKSIHGCEIAEIIESAVPQLRLMRKITDAALSKPPRSHG